MKKRLFKSLLVISFLLITFFSVINKTNAASFAYKDFDWDEFAKQNKNFWVDGCNEDDDNCVDEVLATKKRFYIRLYQLLADVDQKGYGHVDDNIIIATVFFGLGPDSFKDPVEGEVNAYNLDDDDNSVTKNKFIFSSDGSDEEKKYFENETDTLKTLINNFIGYKTNCYGAASVLANGNCPSSDYELKDGKCIGSVKQYKGTFFDSLNLSFVKNDNEQECRTAVSDEGLEFYDLVTDNEPTVDVKFYWNFLETSDYFDKKDHLQSYFDHIYKRKDFKNMTEFYEKFYNNASEEEKALYTEDIISARKNIIDAIKDIIDIYGEENFSKISENYKSVNSNLYWWPIGSDEVNDVDGIQMATGEPSSVNITSPYGLRNDPITGEANRMHSGIDISGSLGVTNVIASKDGIVYDVNDGCQDGGDKSCGSGYGNYIIIQHIDNTYTLYAHLYNGSINVKINDSVKQGQVIAKLGNSGNSTGPHLHFEVRVGGSDYSSNQDPTNFVSSTDTRPSGTESVLLDWLGNLEGTGPVEGDNYKVYADSGGVLTVGHGITLVNHIGDFKARGIDTNNLSVGSLVSKTLVDEIYQVDVDRRSSNLKSLLSQKNMTLSDNQLAALISLYFNSGNVNGFFENYDAYGSTEELCTNWWNNRSLKDRKGNIQPGLVKRRKAECDLFVNGNYNMNVY